MKKSLLIISNSGDIHTDYLVDAAKKYDIPCFRFNTDHFRLNGQLNWNVTEDECFLQIQNRDFKLNCNTAGLIVYRRPEPLNLKNPDIEPWLAKLLDEEWQSIEKCLSTITSCKVFNPPFSALLAHNKIAQLRAAHKLGMAVPATIISTSKEKLMEFTKKHKCITKGIYRSYIEYEGICRSNFTKTISSQDIENSEKKACPILLQERIVPEAVWRIVTIDKKIFGFRHTSGEIKGTVDSRMATDNSTIEFAPIEEDLKKNIIRLCKHMGIQFASSDFIEDENGRMWFLDLNPDGQWAWLQNSTGFNLADEIVKVIN
jgi:hypothetical protein